MRHTGIHDDRIGGPLGTEHEAVRGDHGHLGPGQGQIVARPCREIGIDLDRRDPAAGADGLGEDGAVVAGTNADMDDVFAAGQIKLVVQAGPQAGLPVVEPACLVDRDQHVVIEVPRVVVLGGPIRRHAHRTEETPGAGSGEALARHGREGVHHGGRLHPRGVAQLLGKEAPRCLDLVVRHRRPFRHPDRLTRFPLVPTRNGPNARGRPRLHTYCVDSASGSRPAIAPGGLRHTAE